MAQQKVGRKKSAVNAGGKTKRNSITERNRGRKSSPSSTAKSNKMVNTKTKPKAVKQTGETTVNANTNGENAVTFNILPLVLIIAAVYIFICLCMSETKENVGDVGIFIRNFFFGAFSSAAWIIPLFILNSAVFLKKDMHNKFLRYRIVFSVICLILFASFFQLFVKDMESFDIETYYENGKNLTGGGVIGGYLGDILAFFGKIGAAIINIPLLVIFAAFVIGFTPAGLAKLVINFFNGKNMKGFTRDVKIKKKKAPVQKYRIVSHTELLKQRQKPPIEYIPVEKKPVSKNKQRLQYENPFADDAENNVRSAQNVLFPQESLFAEDTLPDIPDMTGKSDGTDLFAPIFTEKEPVADDNAGKIDYDAVFSEDARNITEDTPAETVNEIEIKVVDAEPVKRNDEPELSEDKNILHIQTEKLFALNTPKPEEYKLPPLSFLTEDTSAENTDVSEEWSATAQKLEETLASFNVKTSVTGVSRGPSITRYELAPDSGVKVRSIVNLGDDISLNLATGGVRIEAPIPGKSAVGVEVPNKTVSTVHLRSLLEKTQFTKSASKITIALGVDVAGNPIYSDISKMPHLLIAGATGMGKSVCMNCIITSLLYKASPKELKMILIDPKKVELSPYNGIPHLLVPVVSDSKKAAGSLNWAVNEMENRYALIEERGVRDIRSYNEIISGTPDMEFIPHIVIIIDELADLMMTAPKDVEQSVSRLTAKARAAGIHIIIATQRPSVDVITGLIKANIPSRVAFTVSSQVDSRTIIDIGGAEKLIGRGDMLYLPVGAVKPIRVQGAYVSEKDVAQVVDFIKKQSSGEYDEKIMEDINAEAAKCNTKGAKIQTDDDMSNEDINKEPMLRPAIELALDMGTISASMLQRKLSLGYARASRIVDTMNQMNLISDIDGSKPRKVLITRQEYMEMFVND